MRSPLALRLVKGSLIDTVSDSGTPSPSNRPATSSGPRSRWNRSSNSPDAGPPGRYRTMQPYSPGCISDGSSSAGSPDRAERKLPGASNSWPAPLTAVSVVGEISAQAPSTWTRPSTRQPRMGGGSCVASSNLLEVVETWSLKVLRRQAVRPEGALAGVGYADGLSADYGKTTKLLRGNIYPADRTVNPSKTGSVRHHSVSR